MKDRIASKIKLLRYKYRKALGLGKQNGAGRILATFSDICDKYGGDHKPLSHLSLG